MTKNPVINAVAATGYIALVATIMFYGPERLSSAEETVILPIAILSLFTLSAAVMGFLFVGQPLQLYLDGHKKEAVNLFIQTVGVFAGITLIMFVIALIGLLG